VQRTQQAQEVRNFAGGSEKIDHSANVVVLGDLNDYQFSTTAFDYAVVHINAECTNQTSDHDPQVVRIVPADQHGHR
jgi:hypothetical protein